jgi:choline monooxygenase
MIKQNFQIDPDISRAETLAGDVYCDPVLYERAKEKNFERSWQFVGNAARLKAPGHVRPFTLVEGCLDELLLLTVDEQGHTHCLSNLSDAETSPSQGDVAPSVSAS